jgi:hypothetical protein
MNSRLSISRLLASTAIFPALPPFQRFRICFVKLSSPVLDMSDHPPRSYELAINGYELYTNGKLIDKIPPGP